MASTKSHSSISPDGEQVETQAFTHKVSLGELRIDFVTHNERFGSWLSSYYQRSTAENNFDGYTVQFEQIGSIHEQDIRLPETGTFTKFCLVADAHCYFAEGKFYSFAEGEQAHKIELDVRAKTVRANLGGVFLGSEESFIYVVVRDILRRLVLPLSDLLMLHGSVVTCGKQTIFFAGDKAMGKSTIALEMLRHGYKIMSDDSPLAMLTTDGAQVLSGRDQLSVTENTLNLFPELNEFVSRQRDVSGKYFLDRSRMGAEKIDSDPSYITHFVQLRRANNYQLAVNRSDKNLSTANFIREFMPLFRKGLVVDGQPMFFRQVNGTMFQILSALLASATTYDLYYSDEHREQIPNLLKSLKD